jgi:hypothetical protein
VEQLLQSGWTQAGFAFLFAASGWIVGFYIFKLYRQLLNLLLTGESETARALQAIAGAQQRQDERIAAIEEAMKKVSNAVDVAAIIRDALRDRER